MSSDLRQRPPADLFDRFMGWVLDPDGVMYGDERERLRFYESSTLVASLHAVLVPWTLLACALLGGRAVAPVVLAVAAVFLVPWILGSVHVQRRRVRATPVRLSKTYVITAFLTWVPYPLVLVVVAGQFARDTDTGFSRGFWYGVMGGAVGGAIGGVIAMWRTHRVEHRSGPVEDDE